MSLTLGEIQNYIDDLKDDINILGTKKKINRMKVEHRPILITNEKVQTSTDVTKDPLLEWQIKDEKIDPILIQLKIELKQYELLLERKIKRYLENDEDTKVIVYYKEFVKKHEKGIKKSLSWKEISERIYHTDTLEGACKMRYKRYIEKERAN